MTTEKQRTESKRRELLNVLRARGSKGITNAELSQTVALRYGAYFGKLYQQGYKIKVEKLGQGLVNYTLISEPEEEATPKQTAYELLMEEVEKEEIIDSETLKKILDKVGVSVRYKPFTYNVGI